MNEIIIMTVGETSIHRFSKLLVAVRMLDWSLFQHLGPFAGTHSERMDSPSQGNGEKLFPPIYLFIKYHIRRYNVEYNKYLLIADVFLSFIPT